MEFDRRVFPRNSAVSAGAFVLPHKKGPESMWVERTTVEYADSLLGTDVANPRLSWVLGSELPGARQTAYQIRVKGMWDSGKVSSDQSVAVRYAGSPLRPQTRYEWQVRAWDSANRPTEWSRLGWWETGLLGTAWQARWIGSPAPEAPPSIEGASWIWSATAPVASRWFRGAVDISGSITRARIVATADDDFTLFVNGTQVLHAPQATDSWKTALSADVTALIRSGRNVLAALATNRGTPGSTNPAGLLVRLAVDQQAFVTGEGWKVAESEHSGWQQPEFDDSAWTVATVLASYGQGVWGSNVTVSAPEPPAPLLRKEFAIDKRVTKARLYISGLAYYDATINSKRVGTQVLDPGFTDYDETVLYATHDVTNLVKRGSNTLEVLLGRGFYAMTTPNVWNWHRATWYGEPRLLAQLEISHPDGTKTVIASGPDWQLAESRTITNSLYAGETYDARKAIVWREAVMLDPPQGILKAQQHEPIEVLETVTPTVQELSPGVYIADMGRTMSGWTRMSVRASSGTVIRLVHGEKLNEDGTVFSVNKHVPGRHQTDEYICAGTGLETWEPKFSYKGFRYVQIAGTRPEALQGKVVQSAVPDTGTFRCSEPFYEQLDQAMRRTLRNNLHGIPTDTPMFEKNGWTGDAQLGAPVMMYAFGMARFLTKWLNDLADSQNDVGQLPVVVPSGSWGYREAAPAPEWTTVYPFLLREMYRIYGDTSIAGEHWETLTRYLDWEIGRLQDGLAITALGDYLPPGYRGNPPEDTRLTATAYLHRALTDTAELGDLLGHSDTAARYRSVSAACRAALNETFLVDGRYRTDKDPDYRQTSNAIPLMFGLVPSGSVASVVANLVADVKARGNHLNTGALGTSVLLRVLSEHGHADVAHAVATQRTFPSWGYWFDNGADTMWEMWPLDSRSRNHYFQGTLVQWLYENVAGLRPGDDGYRRFTVKPDARVGVNWAETSVRTVRGLASVAWSRVGPTVHLTTVVPVGCTAEVYVPGVVRTSPADAEFVREEPGFQVFRVAAGRWAFAGDVDHP
ncbi:glycoside hydrolase family 78 protein [Kibdelosporangium philippinense]|uniref:alpha-L-rhamnosidase n=3 Tax=Kibdelosporangium philippinense TaxID=211113 RepID=A0ABS8ZUD9_9PSEU|nr:glycoside hydrolase family 78 protein [Kibdelosporangium philippinense]